MSEQDYVKFLCQHCGAQYLPIEAVQAFLGTDCPDWTPQAFCSVKCRNWYIGAHGTDRPKVVAEIACGSPQPCMLSSLHYRPA